MSQAAADPLILECTNPDCAFRFPSPPGARLRSHCPKCGWVTITLNIDRPEIPARAVISDSQSPIIEALLDNIRSTFNVGAMFRTADGAGLAKLHLCGTTATPDNPKLAKTALGAEQMVPWAYHRNGLHCAQQAKKVGFHLWALEISEKAQSLFELVQTPLPSPLLLVVGNEISGVDPEILALCEQSIWIPMAGSKKSLNVAIAFGIATYTLRFGYSTKKPQLGLID